MAVAIIGGWVGDPSVKKMVPTAGATGGAGDLSAFGWRLMECEESGKAIALAWFAVGFFPMPDF